jgi:hypothetical protein
MVFNHHTTLFIYLEYGLIASVKLLKDNYLLVIQLFVG